MVWDLDDWAIRSKIKQSLPTMVKNATERNEYCYDSVEDMLRLFCWQVDHGEKLSPEILRYLADGFNKVLSTGTTIDDALGLVKAHGAPKSDPARNFWIAIWVKKVLLQCLEDAELLNSPHLTIDQARINDCKKQCIQKRKKPSLTYAYELIGCYCGLTPSAVRQIYEGVMADDVCKPLDRATTREELELLLSKNPPLIIG